MAIMSRHMVVSVLLLHMLLNQPEGGCLSRCWSSLKSGMSADEIHGANELMMERQEAEFATLKRLEGLVTAAEGTFVGAASAKELDPSATADALAAENEAAENAQVRRAQLGPPPGLRGSATWTTPGRKGILTCSL